jgi:hypothetical protein
MSRVRLTESLTMARGFSQRVRIHLSRHRHPAVWSCSGRKQWLDILLRLNIILGTPADRDGFLLTAVPVSPFMSPNMTATPSQVNSQFLSTFFPLPTQSSSNWSVACGFSMKRAGWKPGQSRPTARLPESTARDASGRKCSLKQSNVVMHRNLRCFTLCHRRLCRHGI